MYKYKDKEFEIIEMTYEGIPYDPTWGVTTWGRPQIIGVNGEVFRSRNQREWDQYWGNIAQWFTEPPTTETFRMETQGSGIYQQLRDCNPTTYGHITMESLERAIDEVFTVREETPRITRRRRTGMSAMASAVEIQRTIGIP